VRTTRAWRNRNFRLYVTGQGISQVGSWFQQTAEIWLIYQLSGSATAVGLQNALRFGPLLVFGVPAGVLTDRLERRRLLFITQSLYVFGAVAMAIATFTGTPDLLFIYTLVLLRGCLNAVDNPLRRGFVRDLVTDDELTNAVSINSTMHTVARFIGPALAGAAIVTVGVQWCFAINAVSYFAVLISLFRIDRSSLRPVEHVRSSGRNEIVEGLRYAWENRRIRRVLLMVTILGLFAGNWDVVLPVYATQEFGSNASLYGLLASTVGIGAFVGALATMRVTRIRGTQLRSSLALMSAALALAAVAPIIPVAFLAFALLGTANTSFQILAQSRLQLDTEDRVSGRVLAIYSVALTGTRPIGSLIVGSMADIAGSRVAYLANAIIILGLVGLVLLTRPGRGEERVAPQAVTVSDAEDVMADALPIVPERPVPR
jgi:MFS family permease